MLKGILFDYDSTLSYRIRSAYENYVWLLSRIFPKMDPHSLEFECRVQRVMLWDEYGTIEKEHVLHMIQKKWKPDLDIEWAKDLWYENFPKVQYWTPGSREVIDRFKEEGFQVGMVSNGPHERQWPKIIAMGMDKVFDPIIVSGDFGKKKPDPSIYQAAADQMHLACSQVAYVGDTFDTDIAGAFNAGMLPVWYCYEHRGYTDWPVDIVSSYEELYHYIHAHMHDNRSNIND